MPIMGTKPNDMKDEDWALLDRQVLGVIQLTLLRLVAYNIVKEKSPVGLLVTDVVFLCAKISIIKLTTHNRRNPCRIGVY